MSYLVCYTVRMMIKETLFEVFTFDGDSTLGFIKAYDKDHAKRIGERLYCKGILVEPVEGRFKRFKEFNR
jgi:hypothetical protein